MANPLKGYSFMGYNSIENIRATLERLEAIIKFLVSGEEGYPRDEDQNVRMAFGNLEGSTTEAFVLSHRGEIRAAMLKIARVQLIEIKRELRAIVDEMKSELDQEEAPAPPAPPGPGGQTEPAGAL